MIETLSLRNFRILREVDVELRPFTLIVGPNASGKSTLLEALNLSFPLLWGGGGKLPDEFLSRKAHGSLKIDASGNLAAERFQMTWSQDLGGYLAWKGKEWRSHPLAGLSPYAEFAAQRPLRLTLDPQALAAPSIPKEVDLVLPPNGAGLSAILAGLQLEFPDRFQSLINQLRAIVPDVRGVRIKRVVLKAGVGFELRFDMSGGEDIPAYSISGGTLLTLGLLTSLLSQQKPPELVLVDELEHGLHPKALGDLIRQLRRLQEQNPDLQIVATSHSPYLLDHFKAEEILLTSLDEEGYAVIKPLTDHPEYERWKDLMAPGEFWSTVGESWITQQNPKKVPATGR